MISRSSFTWSSGTSRSMRSSGTRSSSVRRDAATALNCAANASTRSAAIVMPAAERWPPNRMQQIPAFCQAAVQIERADRAARSLPRIALERDEHRGTAELLDHARRDDADDARMPPLFREHDAVCRRQVQRGTRSRACSSVARSISWRRAFSSSSSRAIGLASWSLVESSSSTPRSALSSRPAALSRGARMKPTRPAVSALAFQSRRRESSRECPGRMRLVQQLAAHSEPARDSRPAAARRRRSSPARRGRASRTRSSSLPLIARVNASASLNATPTAARSLSGDGHPGRFGLSTAYAAGSGPLGKWWSVTITSMPCRLQPVDRPVRARAAVARDRRASRPHAFAARTPASPRS